MAGEGGSTNRNAVMEPGEQSCVSSREKKRDCELQATKGYLEPKWLRYLFGSQQSDIALCPEKVKGSPEKANVSPDKLEVCVPRSDEVCVSETTALLEEAARHIAVEGCIDCGTIEPGGKGAASQSKKLAAP